MLRAVVLLGVLFTCLVPGGFSHAGLVFDFAVAGTRQTAIEIAGPVQIQVYLRQTPGTTILTDDGLLAAGIQVTFGSSGNIAAVKNSADIQGNPLFDDAVFFLKSVTVTTAILDQATDGTSLVRPELSDPNRILLGVFTFTGLALGTTTIGVTGLDSGDSIVSGSNSALDDLITPGSGTATLTVTPEPGSVALSLLVVGAASVVTSYRARRQRKSQAANAGGSGAAASL